MHTVAPGGNSTEREQQQQTPIPVPLASAWCTFPFVPIARHDTTFANGSSAWMLPPDGFPSTDCMSAPWAICESALTCSTNQPLPGYYFGAKEEHAGTKNNGCKQIPEAQMWKQFDLSAKNSNRCAKFLEEKQKTTTVHHDGGQEASQDNVCSVQNAKEENQEAKPELSLAAISELTDDQAKAMISWLVDGDADERSYAMGQIMGLFWQLCVSQHGSRVAQKALELADAEEQVALLGQLKGHVRDAAKSPHANHVLQRCIELMPPERVQCVVEELMGRGVVTSRHRFGCRILQRLLEHCPNWQTSDLIAEIMTDAHRLCRHPFGNFVLQHILEHGTVMQQSRVVDVLILDSFGLARHRIASHVMQRALVHSSLSERERLSASLVSDADEMKSLAHSQYGSFVMRELVGKRWP